MGGVYSIQTFLDFYIFFIFTRPLLHIICKLLLRMLQPRCEAKPVSPPGQC